MRELKSMYIYLASDCNLNCQHCWVTSSPDVPREHLKFDECKNFLKNSIELGLKRVTFSGGEPFLNRDIFKFMDFFQQNNVSYSVETNGLLINEKNIEKIKKYKPFLAISIDGLDMKSHEKQRGTNTFDKLWKAIKLMDSIDVKYQLITAVYKENVNEIESLCDKINSVLKNCNSLKINIILPDGRAKKMNDNDLLLSNADIIALNKKVNNIKEKYPFKIIPHINRPFQQFDEILEGYSCGGYCGIAGSVSILANGQVSICSLGRFVNKDYVFGNVKTIDIKKVWRENELLLDIRSEEFIDKLKGICGNCIFKKRCRGACRANPLNDYEDIYAPDYLCQRLYNEGQFPSQFLITKDIPTYYNL